MSSTSTSQKQSASTPIGRGQLRCFRCRKPGLIKEGSWNHEANQEVFVCRACANAEKKPEGSK